MTICKLCGSNSIKEVYRGPIRMGKITDISVQLYTIFACSDCDLVMLPSIIQDLDEFYKSEEYRTEIGQSNDISTYENRHDPEVSSYFEMMPLTEFRGKVIADLGCGAGSFLDAIKGFAKKTIAVEKNSDFIKLLEAKGHIALESIKDYDRQSFGPIDIIVSHSVIEHLDDPLKFTQEIYDSLKPGGKVILSTPNQGSFLMKHGSEAFKSFFYRKVHTFYFNATALEKMVKIAGFENIKIKSLQNYGLSNTLLWLRDGTGNGYKSILNDSLLDFFWKKYLEENHIADRLFCLAEKR